jgi:hypothetical protein
LCDSGSFCFGANLIEDALEIKQDSFAALEPDRTFGVDAQGVGSLWRNWAETAGINQ